MTNISDYFDAFKDILIPWHRHFVIGGIWALRLHGLNVRSTNDLDIAVYYPPEDLIATLAGLVEEEVGSAPEDPADDRRRSYKLTRDGITIDFLMEHGTSEIPDDAILFLEWSDRAWYVQSIGRVIEAKKRYGRPKDLEDFKQFKEQNFNP